MEHNKKDNVVALLSGVFVATAIGGTFSSVQKMQRGTGKKSKIILRMQKLT